MLNEDDIKSVDIVATNGYEVLVSQDSAELDGSDTSSDDDIVSPFDPSKIRVETKNTQMDALLKRMRNDELDLQPGFQRRSDVWTAKAKSRLIESMFIRIPLPAFYMDATDDNKWLVVDGLQRLTTVKEFVIEQSLTLQGMEFLHDYNGKKYADLPRNLQRRIEETDIVVYQIQPGTPDRVKFDIFSRINTGGAPLSAQEIRHALNQGKVTNSLKTMAESEWFLKATDHGISPKRMVDRECVLRYYAFVLNEPEEYKEDSFDQFLNDVMKKCNGMHDNEISKLERDFVHVMELSYELFDRMAFRKMTTTQLGRYPINKALFESWSVNLFKLSHDQQNYLIERKSQLIDMFKKVIENDPRFVDSISQATGSMYRVRYRFSCIRNLIQGVLS